jgi:hypothetical protein
MGFMSGSSFMFSMSGLLFSLCRVDPCLHLIREDPCELWVCPAGFHANPPPCRKRVGRTIMAEHGGGTGGVLTMKSMKNMKAGPFGAFAWGSLAHDKQPRTPE